MRLHWPHNISLTLFLESHMAFLSSASEHKTKYPMLRHIYAAVHESHKHNTHFTGQLCNDNFTVQMCHIYTIS